MANTKIIPMRLGEPTESEIRDVMERTGMRTATDAVRYCVHREWERIQERKEEMRYSDLFQNEHFLRLANMLRVGEAQRNHGKVPIATLIDNVMQVKTAEHFKQDRTEFVNRFMVLLANIAIPSEQRYTDDDLRWFLAEMDGEHAHAIASLLFAYGSARK